MNDPLPRRRLIGSGLAGGVGLVVAGLVVRNQIRHPHKDKKPAPDGKPRRLVLAAANPQRDPVLLAAADQGIFARYNLDIEFSEPPVLSGQEALDRVQNNQADGAVAATLSWLPRLQAGLDARLVCGLQGGNARMLIPRHAPLHRIEDLYRHAVGLTNPDGPDRLFFSIMMRRKGMNPNKDVEWRTLPAASLGQALAGGQVQAIIGHDPVIWQLREQLKLVELASSTSGSYAVRVRRVLGVRTQLLQDDPKAVLAITLAMQDAAVWVEKHPQEVSVLLAAQDPAMTAAEVARMLKTQANNVHPMGLNLRNQIAQYVDEMKLIGLTPETVDSAQFAKRFTPNLLKS